VILRFLRSLRWLETFVRLGAPFLGVVFSVNNIYDINILKLFLLLSGYFTLVSHIYLYNDLKGKGFDLLDTLKKTPLLKGEVSYFSLFLFSLLLLFYSIIVYYFLNPIFLIFLFIDIIMGITYVHPKVLLKNRPFFSIIFLFISNFNDFLIGWLLFGKINITGILLSVYFGLLGAAGQMFHEVKDYEADKISGIRTNAVRFGQKNIFFLGLITYSLSVLFFIYISLIFLKKPYFIPHILTYPFYISYIINNLKTDFNRNNFQRFVVFYRFMYIFIGIVIFIIKIL